MNSTRMLRSLKLNEKFLQQLWKTPQLRRTFLSEAYQCQEAWDKRLQSPLLQKVKPIDFFVDIEQKYQIQGKISAVDVDIFANTIQNESHSDELADMLHKLRMTRDTTFTLDSTHHAVARYYLKIGELEQLLSILNDRLNYGIFCDYFCYNLLMDYFIKKEDFASAAKVASYMMLQEEFEHPISNALAIYSCNKYLENPDSWQEVDPETLKEEPKEEVKVRVKYLVNPYFDDHFDLWKPSDLVGKTLFLIGQTMNNPLGRSCHLRGLVLYRKYADAISIIKKWKKEGIEEIVYQEVLPLIKNDVPELFSEESTEEAKELQQLLVELESANLYKGNLIDDIENLIKKEIAERSQEDIDKQIKLYEEWEETRMKALQENLVEIDRQKRLARVEEIKKELLEKERILTFFEKEEQIELQIEQKLEEEKRKYGDEVNVQDEEDNYIPPEIVKKRQNQ